jgi:uncharacterized protein
VSERKRRMTGGKVGEQPASWDAAAPFLLDVNVLLALLDPLHSHHARAHAWFSGADTRWATCALTQNAALRIMSHPGYTNPLASPVEAAGLLGELCALPGHRFWTCDLSLLGDPVILCDRLLHHGQITDTYLLALAVRHGGRLATFDRRLVADAVQGGREALHLIA